jgi:hypothetical protein
MALPEERAQPALQVLAAALQPREALDADLAAAAGAPAEPQLIAPLSLPIRSH